MASQIKTLLGIPESDTTHDAILETIEDLTTARLKFLLGGVDQIPEGLSYIVTEVAVKRFNRIGSEGLSSHAVDGETMSWSDDDFSEYEGDIGDYVSAQESAKKGKVRFL